MNDKSQTKKIRNLFQDSEEKPEAVIAYDDEDLKERHTVKKIPKAVYLSSLLLLLVLVGLAVYMNWGKFTLDTFGSWFKVQLMGTGTGDGYPVNIKGNTVYEGNFLHTDGNVALLSDTAFTVLNNTGKEVFTVRHSFDNPALRAKGGNYILYNSGSTDYMVQIGSDTTVTDQTDKAPENAEEPVDYPISAAAVAADGSYALAVQSAEYASTLRAYSKSGVNKYNFYLSDQYITSVSMNPSGTMAVISTLGSNKGELTSSLMVLDFNSSSGTPLNSYTSSDNMIMEVLWTDEQKILAVGDKAAVLCSTSSYEYIEYSYEGKQLTAYELSGNRAVISISGFEYAGACTVMVLGGESPLQLETEERVTSISSFSGTTAVLTGTAIRFYDSTTGQQMGTADAGKDVKAIALANESTAYLLGISQIRIVSAE